MKSGYRYILYIVIILILVSGLVLLLFRDDAMTYLNESSAISQPDLTIKVSSANKNALDNSVLNSPNFVALKNNVSKFDFESICNTPVGTVETVSTSSAGIVSTTTQIVSCVKGNNVPFALPAKTK